MKRYASFIVCFFTVFYSSQTSAQTKIIEYLNSTDSLVAYWDFSEREGEAKKSKGLATYSLEEYSQCPIPVIQDGPLSGRSIFLNGTNYLSIPYSETGHLNIKNNQVTVIAWIKWSGEGTGFVGGMWNEYEDGGKRQYGLFVNLPKNGKDRVCGHISQTGKATPPFPHSIDYSASKQLVPYNEWCCIAFTYDGEYIKSYFNGKFEERESEYIHNTKGFEGYPNGLMQVKNPYYFSDGLGNAGSDFTVGAVLLHVGMKNFFKGQIGGLAVFNRALTEKEIALFTIQK